VGDRYVLEEMLRSNNAFGGEQSGHVIFLDDSPAGDGLLTAVKIASLVSINGRLESLDHRVLRLSTDDCECAVKAKPPTGFASAGVSCACRGGVCAGR